MSMLERLRSLGKDDLLSGDDVFEAMFEAGCGLADEERESSAALEITIRLLEARRNHQIPDGCRQSIDYLAEECGLFPYIDVAQFNVLNQVVIEAHAIEMGGKYILHSKQMEVLLTLLSGQNVVLSATTSFGKSLLVDAFVSIRRPHTTVIIQPTIALVDETRKRLSKSFSKYNIITNSTDDYDTDHPTIFILTQERFLQRRDIVAIDFFFVDEFYKLDPSRKDDRYETLNLAVYFALRRKPLCFMAGPHINRIELGNNWRGAFKFIQTDYRTVTVNIVNRSDGIDRETLFLDDIKTVSEQNSLVFTSAPASAERLALSVGKVLVRDQPTMTIAIGEWLEENFHMGWPVATSLMAGIGIHHGRVPRSVAQLLVHLFDQGLIKTLICTSTLIEGVNTSAANVFIYDKKINRTDFDFFSFSNIRGRVGRMMRHFVGNAYLYHEPPQEVETEVDVPILSNPQGSSNYLLMNVDRNDLDKTGLDRQERLQIDSGLPPAILKEFGGLGVEILIALSAKIKDIIEVDPGMLEWSQIPSKEQRLALAELVHFIAAQRRERYGMFSPKQLSWAWSQLVQTKTLSAFLRWFVRASNEETVGAGLDRAFRFLQHCEFNFPRAIAAIETITNWLRGDTASNFRFFIANIESWGRPRWMKELDEQGIPIPLGEKLRYILDGSASGKEAIYRLRRADPNDFKSLNAAEAYILNLQAGFSEGS